MTGETVFIKRVAHKDYSSLEVSFRATQLSGNSVEEIVQALNAEAKKREERVFYTSANLVQAVEHWDSLTRVLGLGPSGKSMWDSL